MVAGENVAKQQRHPNLRDGGHAGVHDLHPSPHYAQGKVLPWNAQQLADSLLIEVGGLTPPPGKRTALAFFPNQWMPQKLVNGILTQEHLSLTPSSVGQLLAYNSMTISGSYLAIGDTS